MKYLLLFFLVALMFIGCEKIIPDLPRDNLNDTLNPDYDFYLNKYSQLEYSKFEITDEVVPYGETPNNQINKGEYIYLLVYVKNTGNYKAEVVRGTIKTSSSYITYAYGTFGQELIFADGIYPNSYYDFVSPNTDATARKSSYYNDVFYSISFQVSNTIPSGTIITFNLEMKDKLNNQWTDSFDVTVY